MDSLLNIKLASYTLFSLTTSHFTSFTSANSLAKAILTVTEGSFSAGVANAEPIMATARAMERKIFFIMIVLKMYLNVVGFACLLIKTQQKYLCYRPAQTKWDCRWPTLQKVKGTVICRHQRQDTIVPKSFASKALHRFLK